MKKIFFTTCVFFVLNLIVQFSSLAQETISLSPNTKVVGLKPGAENCRFFQDNSWWLPDAYVSNASCACESTPDEESANLIRQLVQEKIDKTPLELKKLAAQKKKDYQNHELRKHAYRRFVKRKLTPLIYRDHVQAYQSAGCNGSPTPLWTWKVVSVREFKNCHTIWFSIRCLGGSCSNCFCKW